MFSPDHPLQFAPIFRSYLWGGTRLRRQLGKNTPDEGIWSESWEIVDHREGVSVVSFGEFQGWTLRRLLEEFPDEILGAKTRVRQFPLLFKYLDCDQVLSVQVHPDDAYGATMPQPDYGKTEAWYVIDAAPDSVLYAGLKSGIDLATLRRAIDQGTTHECLHVHQPKRGDCIFIPAGTVHALGAGLLIAEIQQASDCTFRLFDWNRVDKEGKPRTLHIEQALQVIDFDRGPISPATPHSTLEGYRVLVSCDKFELGEFAHPGPWTVPIRRCGILTVPVGQATLHCKGTTKAMRAGDTMLLPVACHEIELDIDSNSVALIAWLPSVD